MNWVVHICVARRWGLAAAVHPQTVYLSQWPLCSSAQPTPVCSAAAVTPAGDLIGLSGCHGVDFLPLRSCPMTGGLGLKREEAAATANFSGSCSSEKPEARSRGLRTTAGLHQSGERKWAGVGGVGCWPLGPRGESPQRPGCTRRGNLPGFVITHTRHDQGRWCDGRKGR